MFRTVLILAALAGLAVLSPLVACDPAAAQPVVPLPVTAGPERDLVLAPGSSALVPLERATDPTAVDQTVGLVLPAGPVMLSAKVGVNGRAVVEVVTGERGEPIEAYEPLAWVADGVVTPLVIWPAPGDVAALRVTSTDGATVVAGDQERRTWLTVVPLE